MSTKLTKRTLKKLILDSCTKTIFSLNGHLYKQIDGVSMGSPLGPTLANIIMTEFEQEIVKRLINSGLIRFYNRCVDDTLIHMRPSDVQLILTKFNSFHPNLQFTVDELSDNDIHFLDIQIHPSGTSVYRKPMHSYWSILPHIKLHTLVKKNCLSLDPSSRKSCLQNLQ